MNHITIFLAGQDAQERILLEETLAEAGMHAMLAYYETTAELLLELQSNEPKPDAVFLDSDTLKMRGLFALKHIRLMETCKNILTIMFSTTSYIDDINQAFALGANLFVPKPVFMRNKVTAIETIFSIDWTNAMKDCKRSMFVLNAANSLVEQNSDKTKGF